MLNDILSLLTTESWLLYAATVLFGLCIGSFLNVVIYRLPIMLDREWTQQCQQYLNIEPLQQEATEHFNLVSPRSSCPHCNTLIKSWQNIPVISYIWLKGKCANCKTAISVRYPFVELFTAFLSLVVIIDMGPSYQGMAALIFTWTLITLSMIDYDRQLLPDNITIPLLWLGLLVNAFSVFTDPVSSIIGAASGYLVLWTVFTVFKAITGKEGMGYGDFKLLAALGAWTGWELLPLIILISSLVGSVIGILMIIIGRTQKQQPIPFGPFLALAGWIALLWGHEINEQYLALIL